MFANAILCVYLYVMFDSCDREFPVYGSIRSFIIVDRDYIIIIIDKN